MVRANDTKLARTLGCPLLFGTRKRIMIRENIIIWPEKNEPKKEEAEQKKPRRKKPAPKRDAEEVRT